MRKFCISILSLFIALASPAQLRPDENEKGKWGYVNDNDSLVIGYKYNSASPFENGRAIVQKGRNYGVIDESGNEILKTKYRSIEDWNGKCYKVASGGKVEDGVLFNVKWGYMAYDGTAILASEYTEIGTFIDHTAYIKKGNKYGYINDELQVIIPCEYSAIGLFNELGYVWVNSGGKFSEDTQGKISGGKFGVYNKAGEIIVPVKYSQIGTFKQAPEPTYTKEQLDGMSREERRIKQTEGSYKTPMFNKVECRLFSQLDMSESNYFYVSTNSNGIKNGIIDSNGTVIIPENKYDMAYGINEGFVIVYQNNKFNFWDIKNNRILCDEWWKGVNNFQNGLAICVRQSNKFLFIDTTGKVIYPEYSYISPLKHDVYLVQDAQNQKMGMLDKYGNEILAPIYKFLYPETDGLIGFSLSENNMEGFFNNKGEVVIPAKYNRTTAFQNGISMVKRNSKWGAIDTCGNEIVPCEWEDIITPYDPSLKRIWVKSGQLWYCIDTSTGKLAFTKGYAFGSNYGRYAPNLAVVIENSKAGFVDLNGDIIIPCFLEDKISIVKEAYQFLQNTGRNKWEDIDTYRYNLRSNKKLHKFYITEKIEDLMWDY